MPRAPRRSFLISAVLILLSALVLAAGVGLYTHALYRSFKSEITSFMGEVTDQSVISLQKQIFGELQTLQDLARIIGQQETLEVVPTLSSLTGISEANGFKRMGLILPDGTAHTTDGEEMYLGDRSFFHRSLSGVAALSDTLIDKVDGGQINVYSAPVYRQNEIVAVLFATHKTKDYQKTLAVSTFQGKGYFYVVKQDGSTVVSSSHANSYQDLENIVTALFQLDSRNTSSAEELASGLRAGGKGFVQFYNQEWKYLYYTPLGINDWYLLSVVPSSVVDEKLERVIGWSALLILGITALFTFLVAYIVHIQRTNRRRLEQIAFVDDVTGGNTYSKFKVDAADLLRRPDAQYVLLSLDVDKFRYINDIFGYEEGNVVIQALWASLDACLGEGETAGHQKADNFVALLRYQEKPALCQRLELLCAQVAKQREDRQKRYDIVLSIGVYEVEDPAMEMDAMVDRATIPRKVAKGQHHSQYAFYDKEIRAQLLQEKQLENVMAQALQNGEFHVFYQARYTTKEQHLSGAEALVRWADGKGGYISPGSFIPLFERNGFITELDVEMFRSVCRHVRGWLDAGREVVPVSVNVSRLHLYNPDFVDIYWGIMEHYQIPKGLLQLELTESALFSDTGGMVQLLQQLHEKGFSILMDDFGTGYSSLNMLKDVDIDILKLDKSFVDDLVGNPKGQHIVESIIRLSHSLGLLVTAEGVETEEQYGILKELCCDEIQGFYFARPVPMEAYEKLLR